MCSYLGINQKKKHKSYQRAGRENQKTKEKERKGERGRNNNRKS